MPRGSTYLVFVPRYITVMVSKGAPQTPLRRICQRFEGDRSELCVLGAAASAPYIVIERPLPLQRALDRKGSTFLSSALPDRGMNGRADQSSI